MLIRIDCLRISLEAINNLLDLNWISIGCLNFLGVSKGNVFKTVDFTKGPEHWVSVLSRALDLEHFPQVEFLEGVNSDVVHHLVFSERLGGIDREVSGNIIVGVLHVHGLEEAELAHDIL